MPVSNAIRPVLNTPMGAVFAGPFAQIGPTDLELWVAAVVANGGTVSTGRQAVVATFIAAEKASGAWEKTDDYWGLWGENAAQALTSLKQRRLATLPVAPTFTTDRGYAFNGTTQYINTGFIPSTHAVAMATTDVRAAVYERTNVTANTYAVGTADTSSRRILLRPRNSGNGLVEANTSGASTYTLPAANSQGLFAGSRNGVVAASVLAYKNGEVMTRTTDATGFGASLPAIAVFIGGYNLAGALTSPRPCSVGFVAIGASLTAAQELSQFNAVQAWATAVGANV